MKVRAILKSLLFAYALTGVALLLLALVLFAFDLGETAVDAGIIIIYVLACFMGGFMAGKIVRKDKYLWGVITGLAYYVLLLTVSVMAKGGWDMSVAHAVTTFFYVHRRWNTGWNAVVKKAFKMKRYMIYYAKNIIT